MEDKIKHKVIALLDAGQPPRDISDDLGISYSGVLLLQRKFKEAKINGTIDQLVNVDKVIIEQAGELLDADVENVTKGVEGLERLSGELQNTASHINSRVRSLIMSCESHAELETYADIICNLQQAFFNKNATTVNVQNNIGDSAAPKYAQYLSDVPGE